MNGFVSEDFLDFRAQQQQCLVIFKFQ